MFQHFLQTLFGVYIQCILLEHPHITRPFSSISYRPSLRCTNCPFCSSLAIFKHLLQILLLPWRGARLPFELVERKLFLRGPAGLCVQACMTQVLCYLNADKYEQMSKDICRQLHANLCNIYMPIPAESPIRKGPTIAAAAAAASSAAGCECAHKYLGLTHLCTAFNLAHRDAVGAADDPSSRETSGALTPDELA